jgi:hypothetical protein
MAGENAYSLADLRAAMGDGYGDGFGGGNAWWIILLLFFFMRGGNWDNNCMSKVGVSPATEADVQRVLANQSEQDILRAIEGERDAIGRLAQSMNADFRAMEQCCCSVKQAILETSAKTDLSIANLGTQIALGNQSILTKLGECCCETKTLMLQGFNGVDKTLCSLNSNMIQGFSSVNTSIERGFASTNFAAEKNYQALSAQLDRNHTAQLINNDKNTDRIIQFMTEKTMTELRDRAAKAEVELSQRDQSAYILGQIRNGYNNCGGCGNCGYNNGCGSCC